MGAGSALRNHGNQTGSLNKLLSMMQVKTGVCSVYYVLHFHIKDAEVSLPLLTSPLIGSFRASISRDPFYDMLATRKRRIANKK